MKRLKILTILMTFIVSIILYMPISRGASLTISTSQSTAKKGEKVTITVNGTGITGKIELSVTSGEGTLDQSSVWVENSKATATLTITGDNDVRVTATPVDAADSNTAESYTNSTGATIKISKNDDTTSNTQNNNNSQTTTNTTATEVKKSNNANLKNLGITPNDFRGFKPGTTDYNVTVPNNVEQVKVYASLQDSKAKITSGTGNQKLNVGNNALKVVVTAEDGTTKTYTINVTREEAALVTNETNTNKTSTNETTQNEKKQSNSDLIKLEIKGYSLTPKFSPDVYEYKLNLSDDVDKLDVITEGANHNVSIEVAGNTEIKDGENIITVLVHNEETKQNSTYQITVDKKVVANSEINEGLNAAVQKANKVRAILIGIATCIIVAIIVFFIVKHKLGNNEFTDDYSYDDEDKEKINLDDEEELFHRVNKDKFERKAQRVKTKLEEDIQEVSYKNEEEPASEESIEKTENNEPEEKEERKEFFRTSRPKGKHF